MTSFSFKCTVFIGFVLSIWDFATDILAAYDFHRSYNSYKERADTMISDISSEEPSNFDLDSPLFVNLTREYYALSEFDTKYVFCDIYAIQADPDSLFKESRNIFYASCGIIVLSLIVLSMGYHVLCCMIRRDQFKDGRDLTKPREKLYNFLSKTAIQFSEDSPQLVIVWLMMMRFGKLDGFACQEKLYDCGMAGHCTMEDLTVPSPLNSSLLDFAVTDKILAVAFAVGIVNILWNFFAASAMFVSEGISRMLTLTFMQFAISFLPVMWAIYFDGVVPIGRTGASEGIIILCCAIAFSLCFCCCGGTFIYLMITDSIGPVRETKINGVIVRSRSSMILP